MAVHSLDRLLAIMVRLRDPERGCAWDRAQDFASIAPFTIEEAYEVADACARGNMADLRDELGDLLLQVVFHARMAEERGAFAFQDVATAIADKLERRHPHLFGPPGTAPVPWEDLKAMERTARPDSPSTLAGVASALPALSRAEKIQARAARTGFDWPDQQGPRDKIDEELAEVDAARSADAQEDELGDLLFATVNWSRHMGIDPEAALRRATAKFERRFRSMEGRAGAGFAALSLEAKERLWSEVKRCDG